MRDHIEELPPTIVGLYMFAFTRMEVRMCGRAMMIRWAMSRELGLVKVGCYI